MQATVIGAPGAAQGPPGPPVFPVLGGPIDDLTTPLPPGASGWDRFVHNGATKRAGKVLVAIAVAALLMVIIWYATVPRSVQCATGADCRSIARLNTVLACVRSGLNLVIVVGFIFAVLAALGVNTGAMLATAGLLGIIIGLGAQPTIKSFIAGLTFVINDRLAIGDFVQLLLAEGTGGVGTGAAKGIVVSFSTQSVTLRDLTGALMFVSNNNIAVIVNYSKNDQRAQVDLEVSYDGEVSRVIKALQACADVMATAPELRSRMVRPPVVKGVTANGPSTYTVSVAAIAEPMAQVFVERYMRFELVRALQAMGGVVHAEAPAPRVAAAAAAPAAPTTVLTTAKNQHQDVHHTGILKHSATDFATMDEFQY